MFKKLSKILVALLLVLFISGAYYPPLSGSGAPSITPRFKGDTYIDNSSGYIYISTGTGGAYNWGYVGQGGISTFTKTSVSGLKFWVKADTGITKDGGDLVSGWDDQSDSGWHLAQATATNKPLYVANIINGHPVVRFDGSDNYIFNNSPSIAQPNTTFIVGKFIVADATNDYLLSGGSNCAILNISGSKFATNAGTELAGAAANTNNHIWTIVHNGASSHIITDTSNTAGNANTTGISDIYLGARYDLGAFWGNVEIAEILIYDSDLSDANRAIVLSYLNSKYAIY